VLGQDSQVHDVLIGQELDAVETGNARNSRTATGINEYLFGFEQHIFRAGLRHSNPARIHETSAPFVQLQVPPLLHFSLRSAAEALNDFVLLRDDGWEIDADVPRIHAPTGGVPRVVGDLSPMNHGLRRRTPRVDAGTAEVGLFDQRDSPSQVGQPKAQRISRLARANHDCIVFYGRRHFSMISLHGTYATSHC
jgi:hypothetical protein